MIITEKLLLIIPFTMLVASCASVNMEPYRVPDSIASYATIKDRPAILNASDYVEIVSIDRKRVDSKSRRVPQGVGSGDNDIKNVIVLAVGVRKLHIRACKTPSTALSLLVSVEFCASSVLRLEANPGYQYRARATVNEKDDYADFWIESIESGEKVTEPIRVIKLDKTTYSPIEEALRFQC